MDTGTDVERGVVAPVDGHESHHGHSHESHHGHSHESHHDRGHGHGSGANGHGSGSSHEHGAADSGSDCDGLDGSDCDSDGEAQAGRGAGAGAQAAEYRARVHTDPHRPLLGNKPRAASRADDSAEAASKRKARCQLQTAIVFCFMFMCAEVVGGYFANSLAIMTDAAHLLSDVAGLLINVFALWLASKPPTTTLTFGYHRVEVLGALASVLIIWLLTGVLVYEAIQRILHPVFVKGRIMFIVACCGFLVNLALMKVLHQGHGHSHAGGGGHGHSHGGGGGGGGHGHSHGGSSDGDDHGHSHGGSQMQPVAEEGGKAAGKSKGGCCGCMGAGGNIGVRAAFIHAIGDLVQSIGVMIAGALIWWKPEWHIADPLCTFVFSILVLITTVQIMNHGVRVLLDSVPDHVRHVDLLAQLEAIDGVHEAHDLHVWSIGSGKPLLSAHLTVEAHKPKVLRRAQRVCRKFGITHTTIQLEVDGTRDVRHCKTHKPCNMQAIRHAHSRSATQGSRGSGSPDVSRVNRALSLASEASYLAQQQGGASPAPASGTAAARGADTGYGSMAATAHGGGGHGHSHGDSHRSDGNHGHSHRSGGSHGHSHSNGGGGHGHSH